MVFFNVFLRTLGFLSALLVMILIVNILFHFSNDIEKSQFKITEGDENSLNSIALINLNGPIFENNNNVIGNNFYNYNQRQ